MTSDDVTYIDYDPHRVHLPTNAPHVHVRGSGECVRAPGEACLSGEALRARVVELEAEVKRLGRDKAVYREAWHAAVRWRKTMRAERDALQQQIANVRDGVIEALVEGAYYEIAAEKSLTIQPSGFGRARVPAHWRAEAEERALTATEAVRAAFAALDGPAAPPQEPHPTPEADECMCTWITYGGSKPDEEVRDACPLHAARQQDEEAQG